MLKLQLQPHTPTTTTTHTHTTTTTHTYNYNHTHLQLQPHIHTQLQQLHLLRADVTFVTFSRPVGTLTSNLDSKPLPRSDTPTVQSLQCSTVNGRVVQFEPEPIHRLKGSRCLHSSATTLFVCCLDSRCCSRSLRTRTTRRRVNRNDDTRDVIRAGHFCR